MAVLVFIRVIVVIRRWSGRIECVLMWYHAWTINWSCSRSEWHRTDRMSWERTCCSVRSDCVVIMMRTIHARRGVWKISPRYQKAVSGKRSRPNAPPFFIKYSRNHRARESIRKPAGQMPRRVGVCSCGYASSGCSLFPCCDYSIHWSQYKYNWQSIQIYTDIIVQFLYWYQYKIGV